MSIFFSTSISCRNWSPIYSVLVVLAHITKNEVDLLLCLAWQTDTNYNVVSPTCVFVVPVPTRHNSLNNPPHPSLWIQASKLRTCEANLRALRRLDEFSLFRFTMSVIAVILERASTRVRCGLVADASRELSKFEHNYFQSVQSGDKTL
jgi:hypothetical protein